MANNTISIDGLALSEVVSPCSVAEIGSRITDAVSKSLAIYPLGGRTMLSMGLGPTRPGFGIDMRRLDQVIDYPARDMTITVQSGITIARLQQLLGKENQQLPIDVPSPDQATLGGALATNTSGPRRFGYGTLRDYVLGISFMNDEGQEAKAGGRVVKNVAGYDLCKLQIGALGTLGVITQATLKVRPQPECQRLVCIACNAGLESLLLQLHQSRTRPVLLDYLNANASRAVNRRAGKQLIPEDRHGTLIAGYDGNEPTIKSDVEALTAEELPIALRQTVCILNGAPMRETLHDLVEFSLWSEFEITFKANLRPSAVAAFCQFAEKVCPDVALQAHAGNGIFIGHLPSQDSAPAQREQLCEWAGTAAGNLIVLRCPNSLKRQIPVWGVPRPDQFLMRKVKEKLDPHNVFNPGRWW